MLYPDKPNKIIQITLPLMPIKFHQNRNSSKVCVVFYCLSLILLGVPFYTQGRTVASLENTDTEETISAKVVPMASQPVNIKSPLSGQLLFIHCDENARIEIGQLLATLTSDDFLRVQQDYLEHLEELDQLKLNREAQEEHPSSYAPSPTLTKTQQQYQLLDNQLEEDRKIMALAGMQKDEIKHLATTKKADGIVKVNSPIRAFLQSEDCKPVMTDVAAGERILTIQDARILLIEWYLKSQQHDQFKRGQLISFNKNKHAKVIRIEKIGKLTKYQAVVTPEDSDDLSLQSQISIDGQK